MSAPLPPNPTNVDLLIALARIEAKMDAVSATTTDHEVRIRMLERARWPLPSIATLAGLVGAVTGLLALFH